MIISTINEFDNFLLKLQLDEKKDLFEGTVIVSFENPNNNIYFCSYEIFKQYKNEYLNIFDNFKFIGYAQILPKGIIFYFATK